MTREEAIKHLEDMKKGLFLWDMTELIDVCISALSEELSEDGTLTVHVSDGSKVKRVFVMGDNIFGGLYYPDSAENKGEWISREGTGECFPFWERHKCSKCGKYGEGTFDFCPNCGADMREPKGEKGTT